MKILNKPVYNIFHFVNDHYFMSQSGFESMMSVKCKSDHICFIFKLPLSFPAPDSIQKQQVDSPASGNFTSKKYYGKIQINRM